MEEVKLIQVKEDILSDNKEVAAKLRKRLGEKKTFLLNLMSSPGAGKTTLLLRTIEALSVMGDLFSTQITIDKKDGLRTVEENTANILNLTFSGISLTD